jgi:hypothetical protein
MAGGGMLTITHGGASMARTVGGRKKKAKADVDIPKGDSAVSRGHTRGQVISRVMCKLGYTMPQASKWLKAALSEPDEAYGDRPPTLDELWRDLQDVVPE